MKLFNPEYYSEILLNEILDNTENSPKVFVINLPEADVAVILC